MKKVLLFIFGILALWKILSMANIEFPFLDKFSGKNDGLPISSKPEYAPECVEHMKYQKFDEAAICYKRALANDKANPELMFFLAFSLFQNKEYSGAVFYTNFILKHFSNSKFAGPAAKLNLLANKVLNEKNNLQDNDSGDYYNELKYPSRWAKTPIKVWIQHTNNNANLKNAFYTWQNALYPTIAFEMVNRKEDADLTVEFGDAIRNCSTDDAAGCAKAYHYIKNNSIIAKCEIYLTRFTKYGNRLSDEDVYAVLVHEIGHAIGIYGGHSKNRSDVMYPSTDNYNRRPTRRDINTVRKIYSSIKLY